MDVDMEVEESSCDSDIDEDVDDEASSDSESKALYAPTKSFESLPQTTQKLYLSVFRKFKDWMKVNKFEICTEEIMLQYFELLSGECKPTTLCAQYSMLKTTCLSFININISKYINLRKYIRKKNAGFKSKKTRILTPNEIDKFINEAPNVKYLVTKVVLIFGISGACRARELCSLTIDDIIDQHNKLIVSIPKFQNNLARTFTISGNLYNICKEYMALRPTCMDTKRYLINYQHGKCSRQAIGRNKIGKMPMEIAKFLKLPDPQEYTGKTFRSTSSSLLAESSIGIGSSKNWKLVRVNETNDQSSTSDQIAESLLINNYVDNSVNRSKYKNEEKIKSNITFNETLQESFHDLSNFEDPLENKSNECQIDVNDILKNTDSNVQKNINSFSGCPSLCKKILFNFSNCQNVTINVNYKDNN